MKQESDWLGEAGTVTQKRKLKDAGSYEKLFPRVSGKNKTVKRNAGVSHTVKFIPMVVFSTLYHTAGLAQVLAAPTLEKTCENIWQWVYDHIAYEKDQSGTEQVRSPARMFWDRKGDCDCFTTFIDSVLENIKRIKKWRFKIINRIAKYKKDYFQHIYPIVVTAEGKEIVMDCVTENFDFQEPYSEKQDHIVMDLEYLNGIDSGLDSSLENEESQGDSQIEKNELGKLKRGSGAFKKIMHATNRMNPATVLLRNGLLASMKLNLFNVAGRIKWTYLSADDAKKKGLKMDRWAKAVKVRERMEKIFYGAGGKPQNLQKAILTGRGNKGKDVQGFGLLPIYAMDEQGRNISDVIGAELYEKENLSGLGIVTETAIAAASAAMAALAALLKQIGPLKDGQSNSDKPEDSGDTIKESDVPPIPDENPDQNKTDKTKSDTGGSGDTTDVNKDASKDSGSDDTGEVKFSEHPLEWAKANPAKAALGAIVSAALLYGGYKLMKGKTKEQAEDQKQIEERSPRISRKTPQNESEEREEIKHLPLAE